MAETDWRKVVADLKRLCTEPIEARIVLPLDYTGEDVTAALSVESEARGNAMRVRIEDAVTAHCPHHGRPGTAADAAGPTLRR